MSADEIVTHWIAALQGGSEEAAHQLQGAPRRTADEEDLALSAFASFCRGMQRGQFPDLDDRDGLWRLLLVITARNAFHWMRRETREKRGGGTAVVEFGPGRDPADDPTLWLAQLPTKEPSPELAAQMQEECRRLLTVLRDPELEQIAVLKMEGYSHPEIAEQLDCVPRTIEQILDPRWCSAFPGSFKGSAPWVEAAGERQIPERIC